MPQANANPQLSGNFRLPGYWRILYTVRASKPAPPGGGLYHGNSSGSVLFMVGPEVTIAATIPDTIEGGLSGQFTVARSGDVTDPLVVNYSVSGTATPGSDYTTLPGTVTIPAGAPSWSFSVDSLDDTLAEPNETVIVMLEAGAYAIGNPSSATVTIIDNEPTTVSIAATDPSAAEAGQDPGVFTISRTGSTAAALTVNYTLSGSTASSGDYQETLSGNTTFAIGQASKTITVTPVDDLLLEGEETVRITLTPNAAYQVGGANAATVAITDNDAVLFIPDPVYVCEGGTAAVTVVVLPPIDPNAVTFDTTDPSIATVAGMAPTVTVTGIATGTTKLRAKDGTSVLGAVDVHVVRVILTPDPIYVASLGGTADATATVTPSAAAPKVSFDTADQLVATVAGSAPSLTVTGVGDGTTELRAKLGAHICATARIETAHVKSIEYLGTGQGTTGDLSGDNPDGKDGAPAFKGGHRLFPCAKDYATRTTSRNIVRIRAVLSRAMADFPVHFRSFDVDDPSEDEQIDPNKGDGGDNRGRLLGANLDKPDESVNAGSFGYQGRLRPTTAGAAFELESKVLTVNTTVVNQEGRAEVELATSFAPGDNFRVVASADKKEVEALKDRKDVPTTGPVAAFKGAVTEQLSVWRRVHVEQDRMAKTEGLKHMATVHSSSVQAAGIVNVKCTAAIPEAGTYQGGTLRVGTANHHILRALAADTVEILAPAALQANDAITLYQDDFSSTGDIKGNWATAKTEASSQPVNGEVTIVVDRDIGAADRFKDGVMIAAGVTYAIVKNTAAQGANKATVTVKANAAFPNGITVYLYRVLGNAVPTVLVDTSDDANLYDMMKESMKRSENRYADAYIQPALSTLDQFDSNNVTMTTNVSDVLAVFNPYRGRKNATDAAPPADFETDVFWVVYCSTGFKGDKQEDRDPDPEDGVSGTTLSTNEISVVYVEVTRDATQFDPIALTEMKARVAVHEIGHQFDIATEEDEHRNTNDNIMHRDVATVPADKFFFHSVDIAFLRKTHKSP